MKIAGAFTAIVLLMAGLTTAVVGAVFGPEHWWCGLAGIAICLPPGLATLALTIWLAKRHPLGVLIGLAVGTSVRLLVVLGVAAGVFVAARQEANSPLASPLKFWLWVLFAYLVTLIVETVFLVRPVERVNGPDARG